MTDIPDGMRARKTMCPTCVFRDEADGGISLSPSRREEIRAYLLQGCNQLCHHDDDRTICRDSRDWQLQMFARLGLISEPTDEALRVAMHEQGIEPRSHI